MDDLLIIGISEAAHYLGISRPRVSRLVSSGRISIVSIPDDYHHGKRGPRPQFAFRPRDLDEFLRGADERRYKPRRSR